MTTQPNSTVTEVTSTELKTSTATGVIQEKINRLAHCNERLRETRNALQKCVHTILYPPATAAATEPEIAADASYQDKLSALLDEYTTLMEDIEFLVNALQEA